MQSQTVQAKVKWNGSLAQFEGDSERPGWRQHLKEFVVQHYNSIFGTSYTGKIDFTTLNSDRTHKYPYSKIEQMIVKFCNSNNDSNDRQMLTEVCQAVLTPQNSRYDKMTKTLKALIVAVPSGSQDKICKLANELLGELNSSTDNVLAGRDSDNRGIGDKWDFNYQLTPGKKHYELTPKGEKIYETTTKYGLGTEFPLTPSGQHYRTSQYGSEKPLVSSTVFPTVTVNNTGFSTQTVSSNTNNNNVPTSQNVPQTTTQPLNTTQNTTSNLGSFGQSFFQPQINPPSYSVLNPPPPGYYPLGFYYFTDWINYYYYQAGWYQ